MLARLYQAKDAPALDRILGFNRSGDVLLDRDRIVVVGKEETFGVLVWRPGGIIHEFECGRDYSCRFRADALINYARADATSGLWELWEAVFIVKQDNARMLRYVRELGAQEEEGERVFTLPLR